MVRYTVQVRYYARLTDQGPNARGKSRWTRWETVATFDNDKEAFAEFRVRNDASHLQEEHRCIRKETGHPMDDMSLNAYTCGR